MTQDCHYYVYTVAALASGKVTLPAYRGRISYLSHHISHTVLWPLFIFSQHGIRAFVQRWQALCQITVYCASQPAVSIKSSVNAKKTVWKLAASIIMFHIIVSGDYYLNLLVFAFSRILDGKLTKLQHWLSLLRLQNKLLVSCWFSLSASPHGASLRHRETSVSDLTLQ